MVLAAPSGAGPAAEPVPGGGNTEVRLERGMLTVRAEDAPLIDVLRDIAEAAGVKAVLRGDLSAPVSLAFGPVPLDQGIRRLVRAHTLIMIHKVPTDGSAIPRLTQLRVYGPAAPARGRAREVPAAGLERRIARDLAGPNPAHRALAVRKAAALDRDLALGVLGKVLSGDRDATVRMHAAGALGRLGGDPAARRLEKGLTDRDPSVRAEVVRALGLAGGQRATLALGQVVFGDKDAAMRRAAVQALATHRGEPVTAILNAAARDEDRRVREAASAALSRRR